MGKAETFTIYAGTLDDPSLFHPKAAIFTRNHPDWALIPPEIETFDGPPSH